MMTPERYRKQCEFCGNDLDTREDGVHQFTKGWVKNREGGGGHGISLPEREYRWAHGYCVDRVSRGLQHQKELF